MESQQEDLGRRFATASRSVLWILVAQVCVFALMAWFGFVRHGANGVVAAAVASAVCAGSAALALFSVAFTAGTPNALAGTLVSMVLRTALPFFVAIFLVQSYRPLADTGLFGMVLINYLVVLSVESAAAVRMIHVLGPSAVQ